MYTCWAVFCVWGANLNIDRYIKYFLPFQKFPSRVGDSWWIIVPLCIIRPHNPACRTRRKTLQIGKRKQKGKILLNFKLYITQFNLLKYCRAFIFLTEIKCGLSFLSPHKCGVIKQYNLCGCVIQIYITGKYVCVYVWRLILIYHYSIDICIFNIRLINRTMLILFLECLFIVDSDLL